MSGTGALPPRPDPVTGEPRPPHAPRHGDHPDGRPRATRAARPKPPPGCGPTLEWHVEGRTSALAVAAVALAVMIGVITAFSGTGWVGSWVVWLILLGGAGLMYYGLAGRTYAAGADWLRRHGWVDTYRLHQIELHALQGSVSLTLRDDAGGALSIDLRDLQSHQPMWDLVYNGMLHSVAGGTTVHVNDYARAALGLPTPQPTADARARFDELTAARRAGRTRRWVRLVLNVAGRALLAAAIIAGVRAGFEHQPGTVLGAVIIGAAALLLIAVAVVLGRRARRGAAPPRRDPRAGD